jgi:hypothetical protein
LALAVASALCVAGSAHAQTASALVRIVRIPGATSPIVFAGVGSNTLRFATGSFTQTSGTSTGSVSSGGGSISTFAASGDFGAQAGSLSSMNITSTGELSDSFTVTADTVLPLRLEFGIRASGTVSTVRTVPLGSVNGISTAEVKWSVGLAGPGTNISVTGLIRELQFADTTNGQVINTIQRTEEGLGFSTFAATIEVLNAQVGQSFTLSMSSVAQAGYNKGAPGSTHSGAADFGSTLRWLGLTKAEFLDGTPFTGAIQISSASGHDYLARFNDCPADLNADQQVDDADFVQFAGAYNILDCADPAMPANCPADLNNDDVVDDADFSVFVVAYDEVICP